MYVIMNDQSREMFFGRIISFISLLSLCSHTSQNEKRSLFFPTSTVLQYTYGLSVPITLNNGLPEGTPILLSACLQGNYDLPKSASDVEIHDIRKRDNTFNDISKLELYENLIEYIKSMNMNGKSCLSRVICEIALYPLHQDEHYANVLEKIVHYILTPSEDTENTFQDWGNKREFMETLLVAENDGNNREQCKIKYKCETSIADLFTKFVSK